MTDLMEDERTVLMIAARGVPMLAIGRWEVPIQALVRRGMMKRSLHLDVENYEITAAGRAASKEAEAAADGDLATAMTIRRAIT